MLNRLWKRLTRDDEGQGVIEYSLAVGVIAMGLYLAFTTAGLVGGIENAVGAIVATLP